MTRTVLNWRACRLALRDEHFDVGAGCSRE